MVSLRQSDQAGFSLMEALVALAIFSMAMTMVMGAFVSLLNVHSHIQDERKVANSIGFIFGDIARELVVGQNFRCDAGNPMTDGCTKITFDRIALASYGSTPESVSYTYAGDKVTKTVDGSSQVFNMSAVQVSHLKFFLLEQDPDDTDLSDGAAYGRVLVSMEGAVRAGTAKESVYRLQTSVTPIAGRQLTVTPSESTVVSGGPAPTDKPICSEYGTFSHVAEFAGVHLDSLPGGTGDATKQVISAAPPGTYDVRLIIWNGGSSRSGQSQPAEQAYVQILNSSGAVIAQTPSSPDLPDGTDYAHYNGNIGAVTVPSGMLATHARVVHAAAPAIAPSPSCGPGPDCTNSFDVICVALIP